MIQEPDIVTLSDLSNAKKIRLAIKFDQFAKWSSTPRQERGAQTQKEFAAEIGIDEDTLTNWKHEPRFWLAVKQYRFEWMLGKAPEVINATRKRLVRKYLQKDINLVIHAERFISNNA